MSYKNPHECVSKIDVGQAIASTKNVLRPPCCNCSIHSFYEEMGGNMYHEKRYDNSTFLVDLVFPHGVREMSTLTVFTSLMMWL